MTAPKVAIVYDWATTKYGGAEKVLAALKLAFPEAPLYTSVFNAETAPWTKDWEVKPSFLQNLPGAATHHRYLALAMPLAFESFDLSPFDIIISVTSNSAKGVVTLPHQLHVCYLLTPPRYVYTHQSEYLPNPIIRTLAQPFLKYLRWWDEVAASRPDKIVAISNLVARRAERSYHRTIDEVLYPPVELPETKPTATKTSQKPFFLVISRLVKYKRIDLAIAACLNNDWNLAIIGDGPELPALQSLAHGRTNIKFLGLATPTTTAEALKNCTAVLMPGIEDFGITAIEAVAAGKPVVIHQDSGVAEILNHENAEFLETLSAAALTNACQKILVKRYNHDKLRHSVMKYATNTFVKKFRSTVLSYWTNQGIGKDL